MSHILIISEKPQSAQKIANAFSNVKKLRVKDVNYYECYNDKQKIVVSSAVGHLFVLGEKGGESWKYPVFDTEWRPLHKVSKANAYVKGYIDTLKSLKKDSAEIVVATDFDIEGEVIGYNVIKQIYGIENSSRMKFSSLTKESILNAFNSRQKTIEVGQREAGLTRHNLDWFYGINLSRAFTSSIKTASNKFKVLSTGRVQAPTLHFLCDKEKEISKFISQKYYEIYLDGKIKNKKIKAQYFDENKKDEKEIVGTNDFELIDEVDENNNLTGKVFTRKEIRDKKLIKRAVDLWILDKNNKILCEKRSKHKKTYPSFLSKTCGGCVSSKEEPLQSLIRETKEEIGIDIQNLKIEKPQIIFLDFENGLKEWNYIYFLKLDITKEDLKIQKEEIEEVVEFDLKDFEKKVFDEKIFVSMTNDYYKSVISKLKKLQNEKSQKIKLENRKIIYYSTSNEAKIKRLQKIFNCFDTDFKILKVPDYIDVEEVGKSLEEISKSKLNPYLNKKYDHPIISLDSGMFIEGVDLDPLKPKRNVLEKLGKKESDLSQDEIGKLMNEFYQNLAKEKNGKVNFYFEDYFSILINGKIETKSIKRENILTDKSKGELDIFMPIRNLYISKKTNKYHSDSDENDFKLEFEEYINFFKNRFSNQNSSLENDKYKLLDEKKVKEIIKSCQNKDGTIYDINSKKFKQSVPTPFDLTTLQMEASNVFGLSPKRTLEIAQKLYIEGLTSYPRTSSQKFKDTDLKAILKKLEKMPNYKSLVLKVYDVNKKLIPKEGRKDDPAHPAITPTGEISKKLEGQEFKVYDLIVKRFLAVFGTDALKQTTKILIDINKNSFELKATQILEKNWLEFYEPYSKNEDVILPEVKKDDLVKNEKVYEDLKETKPPKRYTDASIIKELEKRGIGTKCLTKDTKIKLTKNKQSYFVVPMEKLFEYLNTKFQKSKKVELKENKDLFCFTYNNKKSELKDFKYISRRKLEKNEKIFRIKTNQNSFLKITESHPVLIYENKNIEYREVRNLKEGDKILSRFVNDIEHIRFFNIKYEEFLEKISEQNIKTKIYVKSDIILKMKKNITRRELAKKLDVSDTKLFKYEKFKKIPLEFYLKYENEIPKYFYDEQNNKYKNPFPINDLESLCSILGNLVGDGSIDTKKITKENCFDFRYHNTDLDLINKFKLEIEKIFNIKLDIKKAKKRKNELDKYFIKIPSLIGRIIYILFPEIIQKNCPLSFIKKNYIENYIGSLFDDEGCSIKKEKKLFISNTNIKLLEDCKKLLEEIKIESKIDKKQFKLWVRKVDSYKKFFYTIPINCLRKKQIIIDNLKNDKDFLYKNEIIVSKDFITQTIKEIKEIKYDDYVYDIIDVEKTQNFILQNNLVVSNSTRADILQSLRDRNFIDGKSISVTDLGIKMDEVVSNELPQITDEKLTKEFEEEMESIRENKTTREKILDKAKKELTKILSDIKKNEKTLGKKLDEASMTSDFEKSKIRKCLKCDGWLCVKTAHKTRSKFLGCSNYPDCKELYSLPKVSILKPLKESDEDSFSKDFIYIMAGTSQRNLKKILVNQDKKEKEKELKKDSKKYKEVGMTCPKCNKGQMVLRKSYYGSEFLGCNNFPRCRNIWNINKEGVVEVKKE